jgi:hypothetical protein
MTAIDLAITLSLLAVIVLAVLANWAYPEDKS